MYLKIKNYYTHTLFSGNNTLIIYQKNVNYYYHNTKSERQKKIKEEFLMLLARITFKIEKSFRKILIVNFFKMNFRKEKSLLLYKIVY